MTQHSHAGSPTIMDRQAAFVRLEGDEVLLTELIALFLRDCPTMLASLREAVARQDGKAVMHAAHYLKGSAQEICAGSTCIAAQNMECIGRSGLWIRADHTLAMPGTELNGLLALLSAGRPVDGGAARGPGADRALPHPSTHKAEQ
jgi:hypothetical protein